jgi:hypothetical protein
VFADPGSTIGAIATPALTVSPGQASMIPKIFSMNTTLLPYLSSTIAA